MQKFIEKFFNISHDASASLIIALCTFILGYLITGLVFIISKYFERRSNRKIFWDNLKSLNKSLQRQQRGFFDTIKSLDIVRNSPWIYCKVDFFQIAVFKEMSYKENFKSFFLGFENQLAICSNKVLRRRAYNKTWENLNNIQFWSDRAFNDFYPILERYNHLGDKRNNALNQLRQMWEQLLHACKTEPTRFTAEQLEYFKILDKLIGIYHKTPTNERVMPYKNHRSLILPIRILNKKYQSLPFIREFNDKAMDVSHQYHEMELLIRHTRIQYKEFYYTFRGIQKTNEMIQKILET
jgi:hypothetical protein